jgi:hypothetical protein
MEEYFLTGQSPQWAVTPMEEEEEEDDINVPCRFIESVIYLYMNQQMHIYR